MAQHSRFIVMELLGPSLKSLLPVWDERHHFGEMAVLKIAIQALEALEALHKVHFIHVDLKPQNMCLARTENKKAMRVKLLDMGLAVEFIYPGTNKHIKMSDGHSLCGSVPYASIGNHKGKALSRRDDLESLGYVLLALLCGKLPWRDLPTDTTDTLRINKYKSNSIDPARVAKATQPLCDTWFARLARCAPPGCVRSPCVHWMRPSPVARPTTSSRESLRLTTRLPRRCRTFRSSRSSSWRASSGRTRPCYRQLLRMRA